MNLYYTGDPILKECIEDESWYGYFIGLVGIACIEEFTFLSIEDPGRILDIFMEEWKDLKSNKIYKETFPSTEQLLRWAVLLAERHNNVYKSPATIKTFQEKYIGLKDSLKVWTDADEVIFEIALEEKKTGLPEFFKDVIPDGGLIKNMYWIYDNNNPLTKHICRVLSGITDFGILELHPEESQWRWKAQV